ncbi:MAG: cysteine--tRNA ligase [bacterium]
MALKLYNTLSKEIETFTPISDDFVRMYTCGPTVYDYTHIGHMRKYIGDDVLKRTLLFLGYNVKHIMNITDVGHLTDDGDEGGDKMERGAEKYGKTVWELADFYTKYFEDTMNAVGVIPPTKTIKATDKVEEMIALIRKLENIGATYETSQAIYFDVRSFHTYGALSGQSLDDKQTGVRDDVIVDSEKRNPQDFVLWFKRTGRFEHHSMHWPSPWGDGFPGWHIECSAIAMSELGEMLDIHTGGIDHVPVHHENEIAQSECATGRPFARFWVHHAFLNVDGEKMSKSKDNFYTIDDIRAHHINPFALRLLFAQTHYRKPLNFTWESVTAAETALGRIYDAYKRLGDVLGEIDSSYITSFGRAVEDDLNTAEALSVLYELIKDTSISNEDKKATLLEMDKVFGFGLEDLKDEVLEIPAEVQTLLDERILARTNKDWSLSDSLRDQIESHGFVVKDTDQGQEINKK